LPLGQQRQRQLRFKQLEVSTLRNVSRFLAQRHNPADGLENLEVMLHVIQSYGEHLPPACRDTCQEAWAIFDAFILKYGTNVDLAERTTRVLRRGVDLFGKAVFPIATSVIARMSFAFEATGFPGFVWIAGKIIGRFGYEDDPSFRGAVQELFERSTAKVVALLQIKGPGEIPDSQCKLFCAENGS